MPIYRTLKPMSKGFHKIIPTGSVLNINWLNDEQLAKLEQVGAIARLQAPPLHKLPGWNLRSKKLRAAGYMNAESFLEADNVELAERLEIQERTAQRWKEELVDRWLVVPQGSQR